MNQRLRPQFSTFECLLNFNLDVVVFNMDETADVFRIVIND